MNSNHVTADDVWEALASVRDAGPLVHNITNYVAMDLSANVLLAAGASPAMVHAREEATEFATVAAALVVNIGTLSPPWVQSMYDAVTIAGRQDIPWVLDPVAAGVTTYRTATASALLGERPTIVRGNGSEVLALAGVSGRGKGVDSVDAATDALEAAIGLAGHTGGVVAVTGEVDIVTDGSRTVRVHGGDPLMTKVTAMGCAASALAAAFAAVVDDRLVSTAAALAVFGVAGRNAAAHSAGPGSLRWRLIDELHTLDRAAVVSGVRLS